MPVRILLISKKLLSVTKNIECNKNVTQTSGIDWFWEIYVDMGDIYPYYSLEQSYLFFVI